MVFKLGFANHENMIIRNNVRSFLEYMNEIDVVNALEKFASSRGVNEIFYEHPNNAFISEFLKNINKKDEEDFQNNYNPYIYSMFYFRFRHFHLNTY